MADFQKTFQFTNGKNQMKTSISGKAMTALACIAAALAGCGGGGGSDSTPDFSGPSPEGVYAGTLSDNTTVAVETVIFGDGSFWWVQGTRDTDGTFHATGLAQGGITWAAGGIHGKGRVFLTTPAKDANISGPFDTAAGTLSGGISDPDGLWAIGFPVSKSIPGATYSYSTTASVATVSGTWPLALSTGETANVNISTVGDVGGVTTGGCQFTGKVAPRATGQNVFSVSLTFGPAPCTLASQTLSGIGLAYSLTSGSTQLVVAAVNSARTFGVAGSATR